MKRNNQLSLPPCVTCRYARRAPGGYVEACGAIAASTTLEEYGRCVNAAVDMRCADYAVMTDTAEESRKPA